MEVNDASYEQVRGWLAALFTQTMNMRIGIGLSYFCFKDMVTNGIRDE